MVMNFANEPIEAYLTSFSASLNKLVKIYINETSATSFPKASANLYIYIFFYYYNIKLYIIFIKNIFNIITSEKILDKDNLTLHDLSSVAPIIIYNVYCLFSSLFNTLATNFKLFKPKTLT